MSRLLGRRRRSKSRSQQTVQRVLDAASSLLTQMPLEDVTTTRIAGEAGLSIGALYRFFPDKQTIIDAIAVRHVEQFRAALEDTVISTIWSANSPTWRPSIRPWFSTASSTPTSSISTRIPTSARFRLAATSARRPKSARHRPTVGLPALLKNFMLERLGIPNTPELDLMLRVVSEAGERLIAYAYEQPTREERDRMSPR